MAKEPMFTLEGYGISDASITVNGEPSIGGRMVRFFIVPGLNTLSVEGKKGNHAEYRYALYENFSEETLRGGGLLWSMEGKGGDTFEEVSGEFTFKAQNIWEWEWARADVIDELTEADEEKLRSLYEKMCSLLQNKGILFADIIESDFIVPWSYESTFLSQLGSFHNKAFAFIREQKEEHLECSEADPGDLIFELGKRMVFARHREERYCLFLLELNKEEGQRVGSSFSIRIRWLHFARFGGEWKILFGFV
jgi:hypothetical protein